MKTLINLLKYNSRNYLMMMVTSLKLYSIMIYVPISKFEEIEKSIVETFDQ